MNSSGTTVRSTALIAATGFLAIAWNVSPAADGTAVDGEPATPRILLDETRSVELDAGLWRSEFNPTGDSPSPVGEYGAARHGKAAGDSGSRSPVAHARQRTAAPSGGRESGVLPSAQAAGAFEESIPVIVSASQLAGHSASQAEKTAKSQNGVSEWETFLASAASGGNDGLTKQGPSLTTFLVAMAAAIVGIGAMLTPR